MEMELDAEVDPGFHEISGHGVGQKKRMCVPQVRKTEMHRKDIRYEEDIADSVLID